MARSVTKDSTSCLAIYLHWTEHSVKQSLLDLLETL